MNTKNLISLLLCLAFGLLGGHRFYERKMITGLLMLLTLGGIGVWYLIDLGVIIARCFSKGKRKEVAYS